MSHNDMFDAARAAGSPVEQAVAVFMLHPETFAESVAAGYENPFAGYVAGRGGVLGEATAATVSSVFVVFEPDFLRAMWDEGVAVRGAAGAAELYWTKSPASPVSTWPAPKGWTVSPRWVSRSSPRRRTRACRCTPAGAPCRWPTTPPREHCR